MREGEQKNKGVREGGCDSGAYVEILPFFWKDGERILKFSIFQVSLNIHIELLPSGY